tara:strand:+ start:4899 stop:7016 length:2118 start_codon:yes stop_codon:yes gene_type:complete
MSLFDSSKITPTIINNNAYILQPKVYRDIENYLEVKHNYGKLDQLAMSAFTRQNACIDTPLVDQQIHLLGSHLPKELCQSLIEEFEQNPAGIKHPSVLEVLLPQIFNHDLDQQLISYFKSEYCVFWWAIYKIEDKITAQDYSTRWHADAGPRKHLKVLTYLNDYDEHGSDTAYLSVDTTDKLKEVGYILNDINHRVTDLSELCQHFDISFSPQYAQPHTGDSIIFNPNQVAHRARPSKNKTPRYVLSFCVLQSELPWQEVAEHNYAAVYGAKDFEGFANTILKFSGDSSSDQLIEIPKHNEVKSLSHVKLILSNIFSNSKIAQAVYEYIDQHDPKLISCDSTVTLLHLCKKIIQAQFNLDPKITLDKNIIQALMDLANYQETFKASYDKYSPVNKPNPNAIFWPNPVHDKHPSSRFDQAPFVKKFPIMNIDTPIGSAGSCFAFEISKYFQQHGYNYVVTERNDNVNSGLVIDGYNPGDAIAKFCANYGILFNSPSFRQLAEKAFGLKSFKKILVESEHGIYLDPYRENVFFRSQQAYLDDYQPHIDAVKASFLACKVFVVTLGLNECWQLHDGSVMSRNPRDNMFQLVKHKVLTVAENVDNIQAFFDIIKAHNPDFKLIVSVSPVPFLATGRADEHHIVTANSHSKAVLLVAAHQLVSNNPDMYYLPSYELVTQCAEHAWCDDHRHVKTEVVERVVKMFEAIFVE